MIHDMDVEFLKCRLGGVIEEHTDPRPCPLCWDADELLSSLLAAVDEWVHEMNYGPQEDLLFMDDEEWGGEG